MAYVDDRNTDKKEIGKFKKRQKDEIIIRKIVN